MKTNSVVIITMGHFPEGDAGAVRLNYISKALSVNRNLEISVLCRGKRNDRGNIDGVNFLSLRKHGGNKICRAIDLILFPSRVKKYLKAHKEITHVYIYNAPISVFKFCKKICSRRGIRLIHDCVEWYSPEEFKNGEKSLEYRIKDKINSDIIDSSFSVISISTYLNSYFANKDIKTIRVPILCDMSSNEVQKRLKETITLFYAGVPLRKDYVGNVLEAALLLTKEEQKKLKIVFVGVNKGQLINYSGISPQTIEACSDMLELCGRVPRKEVLEKMTEADFTVLPRDASLRYAKAGFPSKVVESLSNSTPILCNLSSDLGLYLKDGENAIISESHNPEDLVWAIRRAINLSVEERLEMCKKARLSAITYFDYNNYVDVLADFFEIER